MVHSFLLIGQSNMAGRGFLQEAVDVDNTHIKVLRNGRWQKMFRPINPDRSFSGVSLAESFAEAYAKKHNVDVGLICCADGGTKLSQWQPGSLLFDNAVVQAKLAQRTSTIVGILWHQGESDCKDPQDYETYLPRLQVMMDTLKKELNLQDVPVVVGGLGDYLVDFEDGSLGAFPLVNQALMEYARQTPMTGFASAKGLTPNPDNLHFNAKSLYEFGLRYLDVFETIAPKTVHTAQVTEDTVRTALEAL